MKTDPPFVIFRRDTGSRIVGALSYLFIGPAVGCILAGIAALGTFALVDQWLGWKDDRAPITILVVAGLAFLSGLAWAFFDYRKPAATEILVSAEWIEIRFGKKRKNIPVDAIAGFRLADCGHQVVILLFDGKEVRVNSEMAPAEELVPPLERFIFPTLAARFDAALAAGKTIEVYDLGVARVILLATGACVRIVFSALATLTLHFAMHGARGISDGVVTFRHCGRALRGGFHVSVRGLSRGDGGSVAEWSTLKASTGAVGIKLRSTDGQTFRASALADRYPETAYWLRTRDAK